MKHKTSLSQATRKLALLMLWMLAGLGLLTPAPAPAKPTSDSQARQAVEGWLNLDRQPLGAPLSPTVNKVVTYKDAAGQAAYHIVFLAPAGLVIVGGDDQVEPIVGFVPEATQYDPSDRNPLGALVSKDLAGRIEAVRKAAGKPGQAGTLTEAMAVAAQKWSTLAAAQGLSGREQGLGTISDVRVTPFLQTTWDQSTVAGLTCYNYYTPNNYVCGCVATAMAQLMRFHQWPTVGVGTGAFTIAVGGVPQTAHLRGGDGAGGAYSWSNMPVSPTSSITLAQRQAIGALTSDAGISVNMQYDTTANGGSGTDTLMAADALKATFKYTNAVKCYNSSSNIPAATISVAVNPNLDAGWPVLFGIRGSYGGHAIVCDGYGFNSTTAYHHLNMGWSGSSNAWYNLPTIDAAIPFDTLYKIIYNVYTSGTGEIVSGRVTTSAGVPISGATVTATRSGGGTYTATTNSKGIYALKKIPAASSYTISVAAAGYSFTSRTASTGTSTNLSTTVGNAWGINFTGAASASAAMTVSPTTTLAATGKAGGPFTPASVSYTVQNTGSASMAWTVTRTPGWLTLNTTGGTLAAGASATVTATINSAANSLAVGSYSGTITFTNSTNGVGNATRSASLTVTNPNLATRTFTIYNDGTANLTINSLSLNSTAAWITWNVATPFTIAPASSRVVTVTVNYSLAPAGSTTRVLNVSSNDPARNPYPGGITIVTNNGTAAAAMSVSSTAGLTAAGNVGGPFTPASINYTITNTGGATMAWTAAKTKSWLTLSAASGSLAAGASATVTVSINPGANTLAAGAYSDTVTFTNSTNGVGNTTRAVGLTVNSANPGTLTVTPTTGLTAAGNVGGPFSPSSVSYTLKNTGTTAIAWTAAKTKSWLTLSAASGSLAANATATVVASINPGANSLAAGAYADTVTFANTTNARGNTTRAVSLTVNSAAWTLATSAAAWPARYNHSLVAFGSKLWLLGGSGGDTGIWSSADGVTWTRSATNSLAARSNMGVAVFNNKLWLTGGIDASGLPCHDVWSSADGITWTRVTAAAPWAARFGHQALSFASKLWVLGGSTGSDVFLRDVWSSSDGITWTRATATAGWAGLTDFAAFDFGGKLWVVGDGATGTEAWYTTTGAAWTKTATIAGLGSRYDFASAVFGGRMWVMGGMDYADTTGNWLRKDVWSSADGITWSKSAVAVPWSARYGAAAAVFNNKLWLTGGNTSASGTVATHDVYKYN